MHNKLHSLHKQPVDKQPISEAELRQLVLKSLAVRSVPDQDLIVEELAIERGAARVDIAVLGSVLQAFELKSDADSFARLHNQIHAYNRVFDRITIATGPAYAGAALEVMPTWWGVMRADRQDDGTLTLTAIREAADNPHQDSLSLAMFFWREEAINVLRADAAVTAPKRSTRSELHAALAGHLSLSQLRERVLETLKSRGLPKADSRSARDGGWSRPDANCSDFRFLT